MKKVRDTRRDWFVKNVVGLTCNCPVAGLIEVEPEDYVRLVDFPVGMAYEERTEPGFHCPHCGGHIRIEEERGFFQLIHL